MTLSELNTYLCGTNNGLEWDMRLCNRIQNPQCLERFGFKVYSQNDEDGIIQEIFLRIGTTNKKFIEFGVQDGIESNTHYLLLNGWTGLWLECDNVSYQKILTKFKYVIQNYKLAIGNEFITKDNINGLFNKYGMSGEIDLLSIDVDGNDYYIWDSIDSVSPRVVIIEYNAKIPPYCDWVMPYFEQHFWDGGDKHGASLLSLQKLGEKKGYTLVGTNVSGVNAFFVRKDCIKDTFTDMSVENLYNPARFNKKYYSGHPSLYCLMDLPEGRRQEFAGSEDNYIFKSGFYGQESGGSTVRWMSQQEAVIWILFTGEAEKEYNLTLQYINPAINICSDGIPQRMDIKLEEKNILEQYLLKSNETIKFHIPKECFKQDGVFELFITVDKTWCPHKMSINEDIRNLGIGIQQVSIKETGRPSALSDCTV